MTDTFPPVSAQRLNNLAAEAAELNAAWNAGDLIDIGGKPRSVLAVHRDGPMFNGLAPEHRRPWLTYRDEDGFECLIASWVARRAA